MSLDDKLVFLAGATGLAGSSILSDLLERYPTTRIRAAYYAHTAPFLDHPRVEYVYGDLRSPARCRKLLRGCDGAILAALSQGRRRGQTGALAQASGTAVLNTQLLEACRLEQVKRVVCVGTVTLYQEFDGYIKEDQLDLNQDPHPAYRGIGWVMRFIEKLCQVYHEQAGLDILLVRSANIFGPYARFNPATSNFIPALIRKAVDKLDPFEVWGSPQVTRDVIYSTDFGRAIAMLLERDDLQFDVFNIGSGVKTTVGQVVTWALRAAGHRPNQIKYNSDRPTTNPIRALDCAKARRVLGWEPQYTVEQGIQLTTDWWLSNQAWWKK